ncbi:putative exopolysaccharide biosynthesis protein [Vibrio sinaloensis DSM 21326]|uniref:non-specific protein-tyrosine kinase n=1 Tax=Vibrio sinaloensis DSM 21326 TaxID=945550 RepID=E8MAV6_PHOS4|nr:polysaccharide biosynthesis tyrosine autokinase [Vibrio sinaloensis]EGA68786.1 putative exopolysaccharide biosynthesis protein [Vibrio sinaloensis DSM 21326]
MQTSANEKKLIPEETLDLAKYLLLLKNNWFKIALFSVLVTALAILVVFSLTPKYQATSILMIEAETTNAVSIEEVVGIDSNKKEYYQTQFEILKSSQVAERVIEQLSLESLAEFNPALSPDKSLMAQIKSLPLFQAYRSEVKVSEEKIRETTRQKALAIFASKLRVSPIRKTQLVKISFISESPELAAKVANAVGEAYIEMNVEARLAATKNASVWISNRLQELEGELERSERRLTDYLTSEQLIDDSGIDALASTEISNLSDRLAEVTDHRIEVESAYSSLRRGKNLDVAAIASIPAISTHPQVVEIRKLKVEVEKNVQELSLRYGPEHEKMLQARAQLDSIDSQSKDLINQLIKGMAKELAALKAQEKLLGKELANKKDNFQSLSVKKQRYESLKREVETNRQVLGLFLTRQKETTATSDFQAANARFTDHARIPLVPVKPNKKMIVVVAFAGSIVFAMILVLVTDALRNTIASAKEFEDRFGLVPLGSVPQIINKKFKRKDLDNSVFYDESMLPFSESVRSIRTAVSLSTLSSKQKHLAITSSLPSEGKTTCSINLAMAFAKMENALLIDCDLRKPAVAERFGFKKYHQGLTNHLLMGTSLEECLIVDEKSGLTLLPAGMLTPNPQELLSSEKFSNLIKELGKRFDRIIIDTPPTLVVSDSMILSKLVGSVAIVIKANSTNVNNIRNTIAKHIAHDIGIDGVIINQVPQKTLKEEYGYGSYGKYGAYGSYGDNHTVSQA